MFKNLLAFFLKIFSRLFLWRYKPTVVAVTGNVGKTSTKEAIFEVLSGRFLVRQSQKNYNNEIGAPLAIVGSKTAGKSIFGWLRIFTKVLWLFLFKTKKYPQVLVLEMGADRPGDIRYLCKFVRPHIGVVTAVGEIPVHIEFFKSRERLAKEKSALISCLTEQGRAILDFDDSLVREMMKKSKAKVIGFGFSAEAEIRASEIIYQLPSFEHGQWLNMPAKVSFKIDYQGSTVPFFLTNIIVDYQLRPILAAVAVGLAFGMNLVEISNSIRKYQPLAGRMRLLPGIKNTLLIDDSYNASPKATLAAIDSLKKIKAGRKIVVLADMLELGRLTEKAHRQVGAQVASVADLFFAVGQRMRFAAEEAEKQGMSKEKIFIFDKNQKAKLALQRQLKEGDLVLIKGSQGMRMEKVTHEIMAEPERAGELLVRQEHEWTKH